MSDSVPKRINVGAYERPFSGVGIEYLPLAAPPDQEQFVLHETGFDPNNGNWNYPSVFSPFWRLYYNEQHGHCVVFGDEMVEITPEHIMLIPDHRLFHCLGEQPVPTFWFSFSTTRHLRPTQPVPILLKPTDAELALIREIQQLIIDDTKCEPTQAIYHHSMALLHVVLSRPELEWQPLLPENIVRVLGYIRDHMDGKLSNTTLAKQAGLSVEGLARAFRRHFNVTPARYVTELRVREAGDLLLNTGISIDSIAEATGFPNRAYFSRVFKRVTDQSPAEFRSRNR